MGLNLQTICFIFDYGTFMKKNILLALSILLLTACAEKHQYEQTVREQMLADQDIKDYHLDPEEMTQCVVDTSSKKMPGLFAFEPRRKPYYIGYSKMLELKKSEDPKKVLTELSELFGSPQEVAKAHENYAESVFFCIQSLVSETEKEQKEREEDLDSSS